jgi:NTP pyrophosphatase (non-canonical NTP hydrolase)
MTTKETLINWLEDQPVQTFTEELKDSIVEQIQDLPEDLSFSKYQALAKTTAIYPPEYKLIYPTLGLSGEAGEVAEKIKKVLRDNKGVLDEAKRQEIKKELGDVLWYIAAIASDLDLSLEDIAQSNYDKLNSRRERNVLTGSGDNR